MLKAGQFKMKFHFRNQCFGRNSLSPLRSTVHWLVSYHSVAQCEAKSKRNEPVKIQQIKWSFCMQNVLVWAAFRQLKQFKVAAAIAGTRVKSLQKERENDIATFQILACTPTYYIDITVDIKKSPYSLLSKAIWKPWTKIGSWSVLTSCTRSPPGDPSNFCTSWRSKCLKLFCSDSKEKQTHPASRLVFKYQSSWTVLIGAFWSASGFIYFAFMQKIKSLHR